MKKIFLYLTIVITALLFARCQADENSYQNDIPAGDEGVFTLTATMPDEGQRDGTTTRVALTQDVSGVSLTWEDNDEIQLLFVKGTTKAAQMVTVSNISENRKSASFQLTLPAGIDPADKFDLYGVYGGGSFTNYALDIPESTSNGSLNGVQENEDIILYFSAKDIQNDNAGNINVNFKHLGAIFSLNLLNSSNSALDLSGGVELVASTSGWHTSGSYDFVGGTFTGGNASNSISFNAPVTSLEQNASITLYKWLPILPSIPINTNWPEFTLKIGENTTSANTKSQRTAEQGKNYLLYAQYEEGQINFTVPITDIDVDLTPLSLEINSSVTLTATPVPGNATGTLVWESENTNVATVSQEGRITAVAKGLTNIVVSCGNIRKTIPVTVKEPVQITNVALGKPVTASGYVGSNVPANAVDGSRTVDRWVDNTTRDLHWLEIDLQETYTINRVVVVCDDNIPVGNIRIKRWINDDWEQIASNPNNAMGLVSFDLSEPVTTSKIRFECSDNNGRPEAGFNGVRVFEIEVYGFN